MNTIKTFKQLSDEIAKLNCRDLEIKLGNKTEGGIITNSVKIKIGHNWLKISSRGDMNEEGYPVSLCFLENKPTINSFSIELSKNLQLIFNAVKSLNDLSNEEEINV